jgi:RNA polymerase sigma-70 factor (ECF subfamily)
VAQHNSVATSETVEPIATSNGATVPRLRQIFDQHVSFVWRSLRQLGISDADLEDVCQEVFVVVHRKLVTFEGRSTLRTWLYGICLRVAKDHRRRAHGRREAVVGEVPERAQAPTQDDDYMNAERRHLFATILSQLDDDRRKVFILYEIEGLSMREVAEAVRCPLQTGYSRLHSARRIVLEIANRLRSSECEA